MNESINKTNEHYINLFKELISGFQSGEFDDVSHIPEEYTYEHLQAMFLLKDWLESAKQLYEPIYKLIISSAIYRIQNKVKNGERVRIIFFSDSATQWGSDYLIKGLSKEKDLDVYVLVNPIADKDPEYCSIRYQRTCDYFLKAGYQVIQKKPVGGDIEEYWNSIGGYPDIIFHSNQYYMGLYPEHQYIYMPLSVLNAYIPYGIYVGDSEDGSFRINFGLNSAFLNAMWRIYCESKTIYEDFVKYELIHGYNAKYTGYPKMDYFYSDRYYSENDIQEMWSIPEGFSQGSFKRIIIAPHWTITAGSGPKFSTFHYNAFFFLDMAKKYADKVSFILKPHPNLEVSAVETGLFKNKDEYHKYLNEWNELPNARVVTEASYLELFDTSDGIITDSVSFIAEYCYTLKPMLFLTRETQRFSSLGQAILNTQYLCPGDKLNLIEDSINNIFIDNSDNKIDLRREIFDRYLNYYDINGCLAGDMIVADIKDLRRI